jgi:hypothetical protein
MSLRTELEIRLFPIGLGYITTSLKNSNIDFDFAENKIKLYFLNTPLHAYYQKQIPEVYKQKLNQIVATKQIGLIDLSNFQLSDSCFIPDGDHVSLKGAVKTSIEMKRLMETAAE